MISLAYRGRMVSQYGVQLAGGARQVQGDVLCRVSAGPYVFQDLAWTAGSSRNRV